MIVTFENYGTHEGKPGNGIGATLVGSGNIWQDGSNETYATLQYGGFEDPWGHPYARIVELPLTREQADQVTEVIVTWTARLVEQDPSAPPGYAENSCSPILRWGTGEEGYAGPSYYSMGTHAWWGDNSQSLHYDVNPDAPWEEHYLPVDGSWKTMTERYTAMYGNGATIQDILCNDPKLDSPNYKRNSPEWGGTQDHLRLYVIVYQENFWSEEKYAISEISIDLVGLSLETSISARDQSSRRDFT